MITAPIVAIIVLVVLLVLVASLSIWVIFHIRNREHDLLDRQERRMILCPRPQLSVGSDYDIPRPLEVLRKRSFKPYEVALDDCTPVQFEGSSRPTLTKRAGRNSRHDSPLSKRRRSIRAPPSVPKPRCQKKSDKAIPLQRIALSPLSAITEKSNCGSSPKVGLSELPTSITPRGAGTGPLQDENSIPLQAWPLPEARKELDELGSEAQVANDDGLSRVNSAGYNLFPRPSMRRSISLGSQRAAASEEDLPPLPMIPPLDPIDLSRKNSRLSRRFSIRSVNTITSGITANTQGLSPPIPALYKPRKMSSASVSLNASSLNGCDRPRRPDPAPLTLGYPAGRQACKVSDRSIPTAQSYHGSIRSPTTPTTPNPQSGPLFPMKDSKSNLHPTADSPISRPSPSIPSPVYKPEGSKFDQYHPVIETQTGHGKLLLTCSAPINTPNDLGSPIRRSTRRASIASSNPLQFDQHFVSIGFPVKREDPKECSKKGHKRQHCVRLPNIPGQELPSNARDSQTDNLHRRSEDGDEYGPYIRESIIKIPGLSFLDEYNAPPGSSPVRTLASKRMETPGVPGKHDACGPHIRESIINIPGLGLLDEDSPSHSSQGPQHFNDSVFGNRPSFSPSVEHSAQTKSGTITSRASSPESSVFDSPSPFDPTGPKNFAQSLKPLYQPIPKSPTPTTLTTLTTASLAIGASESPVLPASPLSSNDVFTSHAPLPFRIPVRPRGPRPAPPPRQRSPVQKSQHLNRESVVTTAQMLRRMDSAATVSDETYLNFASHRRSDSLPPLPNNSAATIAAATTMPSPSSSPVLRIPSTLPIHPSYNKPKRDTLLSPFVSSSGLTSGLRATSRTPSAMSFWDDVSVRGESPLPAPGTEDSGQEQRDGERPTLHDRNQENGVDQDERWSDERRKKRVGIIDGPKVDIPASDEEKGEPFQEQKERRSVTGNDVERLGLGLELSRGFDFGPGWASLLGGV